MILDWMLTDELEFLAGTPVADYGTATKLDWSEPISVAKVQASVQPVPAVEYLDGRNAIVSRWQAWIPTTEGLSELHRVVHRGVAYEVDGSIQRWPDPTGVGLDHMTFLMKAVNG